MKLQRIVSAQNERLKRAVKLRERRARKLQGRILIDGQREIALARDAGVAIQEVFVDECWLDDRQLSDWLRDYDAAGAQIVALASALMPKIGYGHRQDQCVATAALPTRELSDVRLTDRPLLCVLDGVEKPGNLGAVVRTADAAGLDAVIVADARTDLFNPNAIRASRGTLFAMQLASASATSVLAWLAERGVYAAVARIDATAPYDRFDFRQPTAIVLGSEVQGVSPCWRTDRCAGILIPMVGQADSLNVASSAAVLFYEARRQRWTPT